MRVTSQSVDTVRTLVHRHFGKDAAIWLLGLRTE